MPYLKGEGPPVDGCLFCEKLKGDDAKEHILYRGDLCYVVLNRYPYNNGHMMVVPYQHTGLLEALDDATLLAMMQLVRHCLTFLREAYGPEGFNVGVNEGSAAGAGVEEHVHLHIVPRWAGDANYMTVVGETRVIPETLDETYDLFRAKFDGLKAKFDGLKR
jgi:ATP adenylyltransferase